MTWQELLELVKTKPREEAFRFIDELVARRPDLEQAAVRVKAFLDQLYAVAALDESIQAATVEIFQLVQNGIGPASTAPEIGLA